MKHKKYHLIYFFSLLFFILSLVSTTTAQTSYLDSLDGKFALQFQISNNFQLSDFQGTTFSGKYHFGKRDALRLGVSLGFADGSGQRDETFFDTDSTLQGDIEENSLMINIRMQYIRYFVSTSEVGFYCGIGPFVNYQNMEQTEIQNPPLNYKLERSLKQFSVGLDLIAGVEWMFSDIFSLSAEYGLLLYYFTYDDIYTYNYRPVKMSRSSDSFRIVSNQVNFGISVYF
jgi:hypothetical protein